MDVPFTVTPGIRHQPAAFRTKGVFITYRDHACPRIIPRGYSGCVWMKWPKVDAG